MKSVEWILKSLNFAYAHVVVRSSSTGLTLGGGTPASVVKRFGKYNVVSSSIYDNTLFLKIADAT